MSWRLVVAVSWVVIAFLGFLTRRPEEVEFAIFLCLFDARTGGWRL